MSKYSPERRVFLRGMLAAACALCMPLSMVRGEETSFDMAQKPGEPKKVSKAQVKYQEKPKGDQKCSTCINFIAPDSCKLVEGKISANGWCNLWAKK